MPPSNSHGSPISEQRLDAAFDSQSRLEQEGLDRAKAPLEYRLLLVRGGQEEVITFRCGRNEKSAYLRSNHGINLDNVKHALQSKGPDGRWGQAIGDTSLVPVLNRMR